MVIGYEYWWMRGKFGLLPAGVCFETNDSVNPNRLEPVWAEACGLKEVVSASDFSLVIEIGVPPQQHSIAVLPLVRL
jgi:hypothetical protein